MTLHDQATLPVAELHLISKRLCGLLLTNGDQINLDQTASPSLTSFLGHNTVGRMNDLLCQRILTIEFDMIPPPGLLRKLNAREPTFSLLRSFSI
jgi:hypothetical protein